MAAPNTAVPQTPANSLAHGGARHGRDESPAVHGLELVVVLGLTVLASSVLAQRVKIAPPVILLILGAALGCVPALRATQLPPDIVLLVFLPALLFWESLSTSLREIRRNLRGIVLLSTLLVVLTAAVVAAIAHAAGLPLGAAWVLGAAIAPTDATAISVLGGSLPRREVTVLQAESLVNDGTALVVYALAVDLSTGHAHFSVVQVSWLVFLSYGGGVLSGLVIAWLAVRARTRLQDALLDNAVSILTPFTAFLLAELIGASGVLAAVVSGLVMSQAGPKVGKALGRQQLTAFWTVVTYLLNGALFVLVGIELQTTIRQLTGPTLTRGLLISLAAAAATVAVRVAFLFAAAYTVRFLDRRPSQLQRRISNRSRMVSGAAGFRGAVSLSLALAVPTTVASGKPFPDRDLLVFITVGVIITTLLQALALPRIVTWAQLPPDDDVHAEQRAATLRALHDARGAVDELASRLDTDPEVVQRVAHELDEQLEAADEQDHDDSAAGRRLGQYVALRLQIIARKRAAVVELRDSNQIDDTVLRDMQATLDIEEVGLTRIADK